MEETKIEENKKYWWREFLPWFFTALIISAILRLFILIPYTIPSGSMENTIVPGQKVFTLGVGTPERGDIATFTTPSGWEGKPKDEIFIKRVIGIPGDTIGGCSPDGKLIVNNKPQTENYLYNVHETGCNFPSYTLKENEYWMMGDNRNNSADSREHSLDYNDQFHGENGVVHKSDFKGVYLFTYWNPQWF